MRIISRSVMWRKIVRGSRFRLSPVASSLGQKLIHRHHPTLSDVSIRLFQQCHPAAARGEVFLDLPVPLLHVLLEKPSSQAGLFGPGELGDCFLDGFHCHVFNVRETLRRCKWESVDRSRHGLAQTRALRPGKAQRRMGGADPGSRRASVQSITVVPDEIAASKRAWRALGRGRSRCTDC